MLPGRPGTAEEEMVEAAITTACQARPGVGIPCGRELGSNLRYSLSGTALANAFIVSDEAGLGLRFRLRFRFAIESISPWINRPNGLELSGPAKSPPDYRSAVAGSAPASG